jgi:hypothetical protein
MDAFRLEAGRWSLLAGFSGDAVARAEPFREIAIDLAELWV